MCEQFSFYYVSSKLEILTVICLWGSALYLILLPCIGYWTQFSLQFHQIQIFEHPCITRVSASNRIFRILMKLHSRTSMSYNFLLHGLNPFQVIIRKSIGSLRKRLLTSDNTLVRLIMDSMYFLNCKLNIKWNSIVF